MSLHSEVRTSYPKQKRHLAQLTGQTTAPTNNDQKEQVYRPLGCFRSLLTVQQSLASVLHPHLLHEE